MGTMVITDTGAPVTPEQEEQPKVNQHAMDVMALIPQGEQMTDEQVLALGQKVDAHIVNVAMQGIHPGSPRSIEVAISAMNSMKGTAQANIKQRESNAMAGQIAGAAGLIASVLNQIPNRDAIPIMNQGGEPVPAPNIDHVPEPILVPGETKQGTETLNPEDFIG